MWFIKVLQGIRMLEMQDLWTDSWPISPRITLQSPSPTPLGSTIRAFLPPLPTIPDHDSAIASALPGLLLGANATEMHTYF